MPNTTLSSSAASTTAQSNPGGETRLIHATSVDGAAPQFKIPVTAQAIQSVESVDLDLVLTTTSGEKIILQQGALQAATQPESKIVFLGGDSITAADQVKKLGILKPVEGGSFRLKSGDASPAVAEKISGDAFGLGKELQDTMSQLTETSKQLEKVLQTLSTASLTSATEESRNTSSGPSTGTGVQKITPQSENKFASPSPGSPPQPEVVENTNTTDVKVNSTSRTFTGNSESSFSGVTVTAVGTTTFSPARSLSQVDFTQIDVNKRIDVQLNGQTTLSVEPDGKAFATLTLPGVLNAKSMVLTTSASLPEGFTINGQTFVDGKITIANLSSLTDLKLSVSWKVGAVSANDFSVAVKFYDGTTPLDYGNAPLNFYHANTLPSETLDGNSNAKIFLSNVGYSFNITGTNAIDHITGGRGDDTLIGGSSPDVLDGGLGNNTASFVGSSAVNVSLLSSATNTGGDAEGDTLVNIQNLTGSAYNDKLTGDANANILKGGAGDDILIGGAGADTLNGGTNADGSAGSDTASYETALTRTGGTVAGVVASLLSNISNEGDAVGDTYTSIENLTGSAYNDKLTGDANANILKGGAGDDILIGGTGADTLNGGTNVDGSAGSDTASYETAVTRTGGTVTGVVASLLSNASNEGDAAGDTYISIENLTGSAYNDKLTGDANANALKGGAGDDILIGGAGGDTLDGGTNADGSAGSDTASYETALTRTGGTVTGVVASLLSNISNEGDAAGDTYTSIENLTGSAYNDKLTGDANANILKGGAGDDILIGGAGADTLNGGTNADGSAGSDTASYETALTKTSGTVAGVVASLLSNISNEGDAAGDTYTSIENLTGSAYNDKLTGDSNANILKGGAGDDILIGGTGADTLNGGTNADGSAGSDTASYETAVTRTGGTVTGVVASLLSNASNEGDAAGDTYISIENLTGSAYNDKLTGDVNANILIGGVGADTLDGGAGLDTASYETAAARTVGIANATVTGVVASLLSNANNEGDAAGDTYISIENLTGSAFNDKLIGDANANVLKGGAGDDILIGGAGADVLNGGAGSDTASYVTAAAKTDGTVTGVVASLSNNANNEGDAKDDTYTSIENLTGSAYNDKLTGDANANILKSGEGNDTLAGGAGDDTLDLRTGNTTLVGDSAYGGDGLDTVIINQSALGVSGVNLDGGAGTDTLRVFGTTGVGFNLQDLNAKNFERIDLRGDGASTQVSLSKTDILALVDSGTKTLTLRLDSTDSYVIESESGINVTQGELVSFYKGTVVPANLIAQVKFEYA